LTANPPKISAFVSFVVAAFFTAMIFIPGLVGIDGFDGGFALSFVSIIIAVVAAILGAVYLGWANKLDKLLRGENLLVHWIYPQEVWALFTEKEYTQEVSEKKGLFFVVTGFALFFGFLFWAFDSEAGFFVFLVMLGLIGLVAFVWRFSAWNNYRQNRGSGIKEAYISRDGLYMNRKFVTWHAPFTSLDTVTIEDSGGLMLLVFQYTMAAPANRSGPQSYITRVPIPPGQENAALYVIEQFGQ
jgi:hypothetical protein